MSVTVAQHALFCTCCTFQSLDGDHVVGMHLGDPLTLTPEEDPMAVLTAQVFAFGESGPTGHGEYMAAPSVRLTLTTEMGGTEAAFLSPESAERFAAYLLQTAQAAREGAGPTATG